MNKKITVNRGTKTVDLEACPSNTAGVLYQKCQQDSIAALPPTTILSTKRGTSTMKVSEYPKMDGKIPNWGFIITTARGTDTRRL